MKYHVHTIALRLFILSSIGIASPGWSLCKDVKITSPLISTKSARDVYKDTPFFSGESASFTVHYEFVLKLLQIAKMNFYVLPPVSKDGEWFRSFRVEAHTEKSANFLIKAQDVATALSYPDSFLAAKFWTSRDENPLIGEVVHREDDFTFSPQNCFAGLTSKALSNQDTSLKNKKEEKPKPEDSELQFGSTDVLSAIFKLRTLSFEINQPQRFLVYSSKKNWYLQATPTLTEEIQVPAGKFQTTRLDLKTFIGEKLEQTGRVQVWIAHTLATKPIVKIAADIKLGSITLTLDKYDSGLQN